MQLFLTTCCVDWGNCATHAKSRKFRQVAQTFRLPCPKVVHSNLVHSWYGHTHSFPLPNPLPQDPSLDGDNPTEGVDHFVQATQC